jgi:hypothetical protein
VAEETLEGLETKVYRTNLKTLKGLDKNARYMTGEQLRRLQDNIKRDGVLTSVPLIYVHDDGIPEILSGNHRVQGAVAAGVEEGWVMEIVTRIPQSRRVAIQLAHNAITGQDDPTQLKELYDSLDDLNEKLYSGLTDDDFGFPPLEISGLSLAGPTYEEITLLFLPEEADVFREVLKKLEKHKPSGDRYAVHLDDWQKLFDTIIRTKDKLRIMSTPVALRAIVDLATERLNQLDEEEKKAQAEKQPEPQEGGGEPTTEPA